MRVFFSIIVAATLLGCNPADDEENVTGKTPTGGDNSSTGEFSRNRGELVKIPVDVGERTGSFGLANATNFSILLTGCKTGWTTTVTAANPSLDVYKNDRECLAKLMSFTWDAKTYVPLAGSDFTDWQADATATFKNNANAADRMEVRVLTTLDDPVSGTETISYQFYEIANGGSKTILEDDIGDPHALEVTGANAPAFTIKSVTYSGTNTDGGGKFIVKLECDVDLVVTKPVATITAAVCDNNNFTILTYKLVEDTYTSAPDIDDARTIFGTAGTSITIPTDVIDIGASSTVHGGFNTVTVEGPDEMHLNPNMILIIRANIGGDGSLLNDSFTYFNIDVETLSYP